jgi:F-type H+-transporting ATPase subunit gamma
MPNLKDIRKRISSVKSTQKITKAMKMVAASKLRKATEAALAARPYALGIEELVQTLVLRSEAFADHPLVREREDVRCAAVVVIGSDRGLCGSFNTNLFRNVERFIWEKRDRFEDLEEVYVYAYGKKARDYFGHRKYQVDRSEIGLEPSDFFGLSQSLGRDLQKRFQDGEIDRAYVAYNTFYSALTQKPTIMRLFPLGGALQMGEVPGAVVAAADDGDDRLASHVFEPSKEDIFEVLLPQYLDARVHQAYLESEAGQHGSRMTAMDAATRNAGEMIERLTLLYNRARQAAITKELVEIVSGAEAL